MRRAVVTGACGFIGRHLARALAHDGWTVHGVGHGSWTHGEAATWGVSSWDAGDLDPTGLAAACDGAALVVHAAGGASVGLAEADPARDRVRTVGGTEALATALARSGRRSRLIMLSSAAVYGRVDQQPIPETTAPRPISVYGTHKLAAESVCLGLGRTGDVCCLRLFSVYGPGLRKQLLWDACQRFARGEAQFFGTGDEIRDWCHVSDISGWIVRLARIDGPWPPVLNGGTGVGTSTRTVLTTLADAARCDLAPKFNGITKAGDPPAYIADAALARRLGMTASVTLDSGIAEYARWHRSQTCA